MLLLVVVMLKNMETIQLPEAVAPKIPLENGKLVLLNMFSKKLEQQIVMQSCFSSSSLNH